MPTYEYTCKKCQQNLEVFQPFSAKTLKTHQDCGGELQKVFHARGVVFKGSGFYATDSRNGTKSDSGSESGETKPKKSGEKSSSSKKPAATSQSKTNDKSSD